METAELQKTKERDIFGNPIRRKPDTPIKFDRVKKRIRREYKAPEYIGQNLYIKPSYIVSLPEFASQNASRSLLFERNMVNLRNKAHNGKISYKADKKLRAVINWLCLAAEKKPVYHRVKQKWFDFKINFITLTLPDTSSQILDKDFKAKLLNPFLVYCRRYLGLKNYVWKIEFQKNGKLHLHLTSDTFIHYEKLRKAWNTILGHNNYLVDFYKKFGHANPNSTDVHSVKKIKNIAAYLAKYMGKDDAQLVKVRGRLWGCNQELSRTLDCKMFVNRDECHTTLKPLMQPNIQYQQLTTPHPVTKLPTVRGEIFFTTALNWINDIHGTIKELFNSKIAALRAVEHDGSYYNDLMMV